MRIPKISSILLILVFILISCKNDTKKQNTSESQNKDSVQFDDSAYVLNSDFPIGDVRRYGVFPDSTYASTHPFTKKNKIETIIELAKENNLEITFPKGFYKESIILKGEKDLKITFDSAEFGGMIQIYENDSVPSQNIVFKGNLISYAGFFVRKSNDITIENLTLKSNKSKNIFGIRSKGCVIDAGTENIKINKLLVEDLGSEPEAHKYNNSALSIQGWNNNPINVQIKKVHIKSSDRHGIYITGNDHLIGDVVIDNFGIGSSTNMSQMQDAANGEEKSFKALWINRCYDSFIENITINEKDSKGKYTAHFDEGDKKRPFVIGNFNVINDNSNIAVLKEPNTNVIIEVNSQEQ